MIIVTGGAGFIGSNIIKALNKIKYKNIIIVDDLTNSKKLTNLTNLSFLDYIDKKDFIKIIKKTHFLNNIKTIFHQGACTSTQEKNGKYVIENNYQYSKYLLHFCINKKIQFLYASSAAVYTFYSKDKKKHHKLEKPKSIYGYSKLLFDQYVRKIKTKVNSQICGLRYFNVYGPNEGHKKNMASVIFNWQNSISKNQSPELFLGSDNFKRDFIYVEDVVKVNIWAWQNNISGIFDCGTGEEKSFKNIADIFLKFYKKNENIIKYIPIPNTIHQHYQKFTKANMTKLRKMGYKKSFLPTNDGIKKYLTLLEKRKH